MARRQLAPRRIKAHAPGVVLIVAGCVVALPALAATPHEVLCSESEKATLEVHIETLATEIVSHDLSAKPGSEEAATDETRIVINTPILEPRARQAIRKAFRDELIETAGEEIQVAPDSEETEIEEQPPQVMKTQLPGITQEKLEHYKRQMYRRDI